MKARHNGRHQIFSLAAPTASRVELVGDFTRWKEHPINLERGHEGVWHTAVDLDPGPHRYRFLVDGRWMDDPECNRRVPNPFGSQDSVREVASEN